MANKGANEYMGDHEDVNGPVHKKESGWSDQEGKKTKRCRCDLSVIMRGE